MKGRSLVLATSAALLASCSGQSEQDRKWQEIQASVDENVRKLKAGESTLPPPVEPTPTWRYRESQDELRGKTSYFATNTSTNEAHFSFPYGGGSSLIMQVRQSPAHGADVIFQIEKGQFVCGVYDCAGMISFDGKPEKLSLSTPADHSSDTLFATYGPAIIRKLKSADKVIVELPFYQEGNRQFTFDTAGLEWTH